MLPLLKYLIILAYFLCTACGHIMKSTSETVEPSSSPIHCYCNLPSCITTSYMCKSENGENGCFKKYNSTTEQFSFGCLDSTIQKGYCADLENLVNPMEEGYECCYSDMCNNIPEKAPNTIFSTNIRINEPNEEKLKELLLLKGFGKSSNSFYSNSEVWFRAVLIAVPICGLVVLLILIIVAVRMLKSDIPQDGFTSAKLIKKKYGVATVTNTKNSKSFPQPGNTYRLPKCGLLDKKWSLVFKPSQDKTCNAREANYSNFYQGRNFVSDNVEPRVHEKLSKQNLNILKLPYKFNELKNKNINYKNVNVYNNKNCTSTKSLNSSSVVTIDSNVNYHNYSLIDNFTQ